MCTLSGLAVALAWLASWIILARVMGLIFPMPEVRKLPQGVIPSRLGGEEAASLLRSEPQRPHESQRPQVKYGRLLAGEAFELGEDED